MFIKIIRTPKGEAPEWVRRAWVGHILPVLGVYDGRSSGVYPMDSGRTAGWYLASFGKSVPLLEKSGSEAYDWWVESFPQGVGLLFNPGCCVVADSPSEFA